MDHASHESQRGDVQLPLDVIKRLAVNDSGFVFDPVSGRSFSTNETGRAILRLACTERDPRRIAKMLTEQFDVELGVCEREVLEFIAVLRRFGSCRWRTSSR
jgi:hypothetical protein